jgi:folate-binding protein YgfZ
MAGTSPLYDLERARGARFGAHFAAGVVEDFGDPMREYHALRFDAGALDLWDTGRIRVSGKDRVRYLHNMVSNDVKGLRPGRGCYATLLTRQGQMEADLHIHAFTDELWLECPAACRKSALQTLNRFVVGDVVTIEDMSNKLCLLSLQGPQAREKMEQTLDCPLGELRALEHCVVERSSGKWVAVRRDRIGADGWDLWLPAEDAAGIWLRWIGTGKILPVGYTAMNWMRTEAGVPWYGVDMDERNLPMEMGLDLAISMTKGCYRGQEIVARVTHRGHLDRKLAGIAMEGARLPPKGATVEVQGNRIGVVTSAIPSPRLGRVLALCVLNTAYGEPGTKVEVARGPELCPAEVVALPL